MRWAKPQYNSPHGLMETMTEETLGNYDKRYNLRRNALLVSLCGVLCAMSLLSNIRTSHLATRGFSQVLDYNVPEPEPQTRGLNLVDLSIQRVEHPSFTIDVVNKSIEQALSPSNTATVRKLPLDESINLVERTNDVSLLPPTALNVVDLSITHVEPPSNISAAVCYKTLFGDIDLGIVIQWAAYNRLLGFDALYFFYRPEVSALPRWNELTSLPYVHLIEYTRGSRDNYYDQDRTEGMCLSRSEYAANFDWVLVADIDEYLWFPEHVGIKEFLQSYSNLSYLSFGKRMYTLDHRLDLEAVNHVLDTSMNSSTVFAVSMYPFYMHGYFCHNRYRRGNPRCPIWRGRAKVIVRPKVHKRVAVHGTNRDPKPDEGAIHFHPDKAHFKEWPEIFAAHNVTKRPSHNFTIRSQDDVHVHNIHTGYLPIDGGTGEFLVDHDDLLQGWFEYVVSRATRTAFEQSRK